MKSLDCHRLRAHSEHVQAEAERKLVSELNRIEQERREKELKIEELNRELRKANLQNFVRETSGSKVIRSLPGLLLLILLY